MSSGGIIDTINDQNLLCDVHEGIYDIEQRIVQSLHTVRMRSSSKKHPIPVNNKIHTHETHNTTSNLLSNQLHTQTLVPVHCKGTLKRDEQRRRQH